jgi:hypothetical protein
MVLVQPPKVFIPDSVLDGTLRHYELNTFIINLKESIPYPIEQTVVQQVCDLYKIGTIRDGYMAGATTFPYIDIDSNTRAIQVRKYDKNNHGTKTTFIHSLLKSHYDKLNREYPKWLAEYPNNDSVVSCLFGEHLLKEYPDRPVNIVEAPKTAIIATLYFGHPASNTNVPIWLASFNLSSLNFARCKVIRNRKVTLFPDLSTEGRAYKQWKAKALELSDLVPSSQWIMSRLLEDSATSADRAKGADLADFLVRLDWKKFHNRQTTGNEPPPSRANNSNKAVIKAPIPPPPSGAVNSEITVEAPPSEATSPVPDEAAAYAELMGYFERRRIEFKAENMAELGQVSEYHDAEEIHELEAYFRSCTYPSEPLMMDGFPINDCSKFVHSHFSFLRASTRQVYRLPYLNRLRRLRAIMEAYDVQSIAV